MPFYSCRSYQPDEFAITKLNDELEPESTYVLRMDDEGQLTCECPASVRPTCRHRQMLPHFRTTQRVNTGWVLDWDNGAQWRQYVGPLGEPEPEPANELASLPADTTPYTSFASDFADQPIRRRGL